MDLVRFGYAQLAIQRNSRGMHLGLVVTITDKVRPFYEEAERLAAWLAEQHKAAFRPFAGVLSSANKGDTLVAQKPNQRIFLYRFLRKCGHRPLCGSWKAYEKDGGKFRTTILTVTTRHPRQFPVELISLSLTSDGVRPGDIDRKR